MFNFYHPEVDARFTFHQEKLLQARKHDFKSFLFFWFNVSQFLCNTRSSCLLLYPTQSSSNSGRQGFFTSSSSSPINRFSLTAYTSYAFCEWALILFDVLYDSISEQEFKEAGLQVRPLFILILAFARLTPRQISLTPSKSESDPAEYYQTLRRLA